MKIDSTGVCKSAMCFRFYMTSIAYCGITHAFDLKIATTLHHLIFTLRFCDTTDLIQSLRFHLTEDSQDLSKEEMMSMAHFYPRKQ